MMASEHTRAIFLTDVLSTGVLSGEKTPFPPVTTGSDHTP